MKRKQSTDWQGWILVVVTVTSAIAISGLLLIAWARSVGVVR